MALAALRDREHEGLRSSFTYAGSEYHKEIMYLFASRCYIKKVGR